MLYDLFNFVIFLALDIRNMYTCMCLQVFMYFMISKIVKGDDLRIKFTRY